MKWYAAPCALSLLALGSCSFFGFGTASKTGPISPDEGYLPMSGNAIDVGPDQRTLFHDLEQERNKNRDQLEKIGILTSANEQLKGELTTVKNSLSMTDADKMKSTHQASELAQQLRDLKTKVLMLQIENAKLAQSKVLLGLAAVRNRRDAASASKANPMPMSGANR